MRIILKYYHNILINENSSRYFSGFYLSFNLVQAQTTTPPPQVQGVTLTKTIQDSSAALRVSWNAVSGSGITYTVCYSVNSNSGTASYPPSNANCDMSGIIGTSTTLSPLNPGLFHFIWVAAVSSNGQQLQGPYSSRQIVRTYRGEE